MQYLPQPMSGQLYPPGGWSMPTTGGDGSMAGNPAFANNIGMLGFDETRLAQLHPMSAAHPEFYQTPPHWDPAINMTPTTFPDGSVAGSQMPLAQTRSFDTSIHMLGDQKPEDIVFYSQPYFSSGLTIPTLDQKPEDMVFYSQPYTSPGPNFNYLPSPNTTPLDQPTQNHSPNRDNCRCFNGCVQSLLDLHNASSRNPTPIDLVLAVNEKAVEESANLMACKKCFGQSGADTTTMFLITILHKTALSYKASIHAHCGFSNVVMPQGNGYTHNDANDNMRKAEFLGAAVRTLEDVFTRFRGQCETGTTIPLMARIGHIISSSLELIDMVLGPLANNDANEVTPDEFVTGEKGV